MVVWREESLLIISVLHGAILLEGGCGGSRHLSCGLGDAGLGHFLLDAGECGFVRFVRSFRCRFHVYLLIARRTSSYSCLEPQCLVQFRV